jgi:glycosyltransferase involved in cell wall biosynthesis
MRIIHVVETLHVGGLERVVVDLVKEQVKRGHQCLVICLFEEGRLANELSDSGIKLEVCNKTSGIDFKAINKLAEQIKSFNPDVVHTHNLVCNYYTACAKLKAVSKVLLINTRHGIGRGKVIIKELFLYGVSLLITRWVVGVCDVTRDKLRKEFSFFRKKIITVHNGIVIDKFKKKSFSDKRRVLKQLGINGKPILVTIVARLNPVKNHKLLLQAFAQIQQQISDCYLVIIGGGELITNLQELTLDLNLKQKVIFLGDRNDVTDLLSGMDLFVLCSKQEGYSISLLEACASGLALIATDVGGNKEIVTKDNGVLVQSDNVQALSKGISQIILDKQGMQKMGENSRKWVVNNGSVEVMANKYEELYTV